MYITHLQNRGGSMLNKKLQKNFTIADNRIMQCEGLSFGARGLYLYMKSLKNISVFSEKELAKNGNISVKKCKKLLGELLEAKLIEKENIKE